MPAQLRERACAQTRQRARQWLISAALALAMKQPWLPHSPPLKAACAAAVFAAAAIRFDAAAQEAEVFREGCSPALEAVSSAVDELARVAASQGGTFRSSALRCGAANRQPSAGLSLAPRSSRLNLV